MDIDFALDFFSEDRTKAIGQFRGYTKEYNTDTCLEYEERLRVSDKEVVECLREIGIATISELQSLPREQRDDVIRKIKDLKDVPIRQVARITGISKSVIDRA